jgi:hypothetical protein
VVDGLDDVANFGFEGVVHVRTPIKLPLYF